MQLITWDRRGVLWGLSAMPGAGILGASTTPRNGAAGQVFVGHRASEAQSAGQRLRLPSSHLRVAI
jgi:hypothetical protein